MKLGKILAGVAVASLVAAPVVAQANTRAAQSTVSLAPIAGETNRIASPVEESEEALAGLKLIYVLIFLLLSGFTLNEIMTSPGILR